MTIDITTSNSTGPRTQSRSRLARSRLPLPRYALISAWSIPVLLVGQFAMVAIIPIALVSYATVRLTALRPLRGYSGAVAALYATALGIWIVRPDGAQSLSKDIHPALLSLIVVASVALLVRALLRRR